MLLAPSDLDHRKLSQVLAAIHAARRRFRRPVLSACALESWNLEEGIVKSGSFNIDRGVGVRAVFR
jgi:TldD protein